jgi:hypothetical protein
VPARQSPWPKYAARLVNSSNNFSYLVAADELGSPSFLLPYTALFLSEMIVPPPEVSNPVPLNTALTSDIAAWPPADATLMPDPALFLILLSLIKT